MLSLRKPSKEEINKAQKLYSKIKKIRRSEAILKERIKFHKMRINLLTDSELFFEEIINSNYCKSDDKISSLNEIPQKEACSGIKEVFVIPG